MSLSATFLTYAVSGLNVSIDDRLEALLAQVVEAGRAAWPQVNLPPDVFIRHLAERLPADVPPLAAVRGMKTTDLYLACACSRGDANALALLDEKVMKPVWDMLAGRKVVEGLEEEARQELRTRLLVAGGAAPPRIADYQGRSSLQSWLFVAAARLALELRGTRGIGG